MKIRAVKQWSAAACLALVTACAWAQSAPRRIVADVVRFDGAVLTVRPASGPEEHVRLAQGARITTRQKATVDQVAVNTFVGVTAAPRDDGMLVASEIQIFPEAQRGTGEGHRPMEGRNTMTNATVTGAARTTEGTIGTVARESGERRLTLTYKDGEKSVIVPPTAIVFTSGSGDASLLKPGAHVVVYVTRQPDGTLASDRVSVGMDGYAPTR